MLKVVRIVALVLVGLGVLAGVGIFGLTTAAKSPSYCSSCHVMQPYVDSATHTDWLAYTHAQAGVTCQDCHPQSTGDVLAEFTSNLTNSYPTPLAPIKFETATCLKCHGTYDQLAQRTAGLERNPHDSHQGQLDCRTCHRVHSASVYYCGQCHGDATMPTVGWVMPQS